VQWTAFDYGFAAALVGALALGLWAIVRGTRRGRKRLILVLLALGLFALVWAEGAVGIFH